MADTAVPIAKSDADIEHDIYQLMLDILGTRLSRDHVKYRVQDSVVILTGHIASSFGYEMLISNISQLDGVVAIDNEALYSDEDLRMQISENLPIGLRVHLLHGVAGLAGRLPADVDLLEVVSRIAELRGITSVDTDAVRQ